MRWQALQRNPFFLRSWWVWRREQRGRLHKSLWVWAVPVVLIPSAVASIIAVAGPGLNPDSTLATSLVFGAVALFLMLTGLSVGITTSCYQRERDQGALTVVSLTATSPHQEVWGRWAGALTGVFQGWLAGGVLVVGGVGLAGCEGLAYDPVTPALRLVFLWLFVGLWCAALGAIGLYFSSRSHTVTAAVTGTIATVLGLTAGYAIAAGFIIFYFDAPPQLLAWTIYLPPHPGAFFYIVSGEHPAVAMGILAFTWTAFVALMLMLTARSVRDGHPLRVAAQAPPAPGPTGLVLAGTGMAPANRSVATPWSQAAPAAAARAPQIQRRFDPAAAHRPRTLMDHLLRPFRHNPFYVAYRRGFMRLYAGTAAAPGSALPPGIILCGLFGYCLSFHSLLASSRDGAAYLGGVLVAAVALASLVSFVEGASLGSRALGAERDQSTWPLLLVTGVSPARVLSGKLAACFYALSGEWTWTLPLWAIAFFAGSPVGVLALVLVPPACTAAGILLGLWLASQPRFLIINLPRVFITLGATFIVVYLASNLWSFDQLIAWMNPFVPTWEMVAHSDPAVVLPALLTWMTQVAAAGALAWMTYRSAERRLARLMRGE